EVEPAMTGIPAERVYLAGPIAIAEIGRNEVLGADGAGVAHRERALLDRTADRLPDVDDGESMPEQPLGLVAEQVPDALWTGALGVVVVGVAHGVLHAAFPLLDPRRGAEVVVEGDDARCAGQVPHQRLELAVVDRLHGLLVPEVRDRRPVAHQRESLL